MGLPRRRSRKARRRAALPGDHALNYGTGVFEGIRAYWSEEKGTLHVLKLREHYERFEKSCPPAADRVAHTVDELCEITQEILRRNARDRTPTSGR